MRQFEIYLMSSESSSVGSCFFCMTSVSVFPGVEGDDTEQNRDTIVVDQEISLQTL